MTEAMKEEMSARSVLAVLVGLLVTILALQGIASVKPGGFEAFAQATGSPTPGSPIIKLINPDSTTSRELSAKNDGTDTNYHLVAWVSAVPQNALVEFKFQSSTAGSREQTIFCQETQSTAARFVSPDTFECKWNLADAPESSGAIEAAGGNTATNGTVRAILYSNGQEQSRDEESVAINNQDRPPPSPPQDTRVENQGDTVEITYPANGGPVGFYTPPGTNARASGIIEVTSSADTTDIVVYYSKSAPGSEPAFINCGTETRANAQDGIRCTLAAGDRSTQVTAVAAVARDIAEDPVGQQQGTANVDAGDAHRAFGYEQDPTSVLLDPQSHRVDANASGFFACSQIIKATVLDQSQRKVAGANVDVHATGPTDNLSFDDDEATGNANSRSQAPDQGGHTTETSKNCEATTPSASNNDGNSTQGEHEQAGDGDRKHIESRDGTNDSGIFTFQLFSPNSGVTQFTAYADEDGNDLFCASEAAGNGSVGWGVDPGSPTGVPAEQTSCPKPSPGQTTTPTPANTTARPTGTATATATATSTGPSTSRTVTMSVDRSRVVAGRQVTFSGQILSGDQSCIDNEFVQIRRRVLGTTTFSDILTTGTDAQGRFTFTRRVTESADYIAVATAHDNCREASSGEVTVAVKVKVAIIASDTTPNRGDRVRIKSSVVPQHDGTRLILQRKKGNRWVKVAVEKLNRRSRAQFVITANFGSRTFRTLWKSQDAEHESNKSRGITIRT